MLRSFILGLCLGALYAAPSFAALRVSETAPDFRAIASLGGKELTFHLYDALKAGPVVVYFYPSAYTQGCDLEAHTFAEDRDEFTKAHASILGVSGDNLKRLNSFAADPNFCAGKFPIAADETLAIARTYRLATVNSLSNVKDINGAKISHSLIERVTFVVGQDHKIVAVLSSRADVSQKINQLIEKTDHVKHRVSPSEDALTPDQHVTKSLEIVQHMRVRAD
jgi:peroxiredoxin